MPICLSIGLNSKPQVWLSVDGPVLWEDLSEALWDPFVLARIAFDPTWFAIKEIRW